MNPVIHLLYAWAVASTDLSRNRGYSPLEMVLQRAGQTCVHVLQDRFS